VTRLITGDTGSMNPVGLYAECSTMATIVILFGPSARPAAASTPLSAAALAEAIPVPNRAASDLASGGTGGMRTSERLRRRFTSHC
jgi:hypothetical protein